MLTELALALQAHQTSQGHTAPGSARAVPSQTSLARSVPAPTPPSTEAPAARAASLRLTQPPHLPRLLSRPHPCSMNRSSSSHTCCHCRCKRPPLPELLLFSTAAACSQSASRTSVQTKVPAGILNCPCSLSLGMDSLMANIMTQVLSQALNPHPISNSALPSPACLTRTRGEMEQEIISGQYSAPKVPLCTSGSDIMPCLCPL